MQSFRTKKCVLLVQGHIEYQRMPDKGKFGRHVQICKLVWSMVENCSDTLLFWSNAVHEYIDPISYICTAYFWWKTVDNVICFEIRSPFSDMQMRKFGALELVGRPPVFKYSCLWVCMSNYVPMQCVCLVQEGKECQLCESCDAIFSYANEEDWDFKTAGPPS